MESHVGSVSEALFGRGVHLEGTRAQRGVCHIQVYTLSPCTALEVLGSLVLS